MERETEMLTTQQVAERFHISVPTVRSLVYKGKLQPYRRVGHKENFFRLTDLEAVLAYKPVQKP